MDSRSERSWWDRNWPWVVGCGCLAPLLLVAGCVACGAYIWQRGAEPYEAAAAAASKSPALIARIGEPIETRWAGNMNLEISSGEARFDLDVSGPDGAGRVEVRARRAGGEWEIAEMIAWIDGDEEPIDLLDGHAAQRGGEVTL